MKLVFYSGGNEFQNKELDKCLHQLILQKNPTITFIPSSSFYSDGEFHDFVKHYEKLNIKKFLNFPLDVPHDKILLEEMLKSHVIYLGGGNTFHFLYYLRKRKLIPEIRKFVQRGGILCGLSAGSILMTEDIKTAGFPSFDCDVNDIGIENFSALNLVKFYFFPHFRNSSRYDDAFKYFSLKNDKLTVACPDGSGVVVDGAETRFVGRTYLFFKGQKLVLN